MVCNEAGGWDGLGRQTVVGAQYRDLGNLGKVHKNHTSKTADTFYLSVS